MRFCRSRHRVLILFTILVSPLANAGETPDEVLQNVKRKYDSIKDAELRFSQRVKFAVAKLEQSVSGTLFLKKENKYRVELDDQTIVTDGVTVWSYSAADKQVLVDNFRKDERMLSPEKILTGTPSDFHSTILGREVVKGKPTVRLKLVPNDDQSFVQVLRLWVDETTWFISKVEVVDAGGKETTYIVSNVNVNIGLEDSRFTYTIPEGVEVVDLR